MTSDGKTNRKNAEDADVLPILIKKYPNRRLYNTSNSAYIVLDDIIDLVKAKTDFVIEDAKSGEDITRSILNQIIFEKETKFSDFHFPLEFQKQLIALYGDSYGTMLPDFLSQSMNLFTSELKKQSKGSDDPFTRNAQAMVEFSQNLARHNMELFKQSWSFFSFPDTRTAERGSKPKRQQEDDTHQESTTELDDIQAQIDALQKRLKSLK